MLTRLQFHELIMLCLNVNRKYHTLDQDIYMYLFFFWWRGVLSYLLLLVCNVLLVQKGLFIHSFIQNSCMINKQFVQSEGRNPSHVCTFIPGNALLISILYIKNSNEDGFIYIRLLLGHTFVQMWDLFESISSIGAHVWGIRSNTILLCLCLPCCFFTEIIRKKLWYKCTYAPYHFNNDITCIYVVIIYTTVWNLTNGKIEIHLTILLKLINNLLYCLISLDVISALVRNFHQHELHLFNRILSAW